MSQAVGAAGATDVVVGAGEGASAPGITVTQELGHKAAYISPLWVSQ